MVAKSGLATIFVKVIGSSCLFVYSYCILVVLAKQQGGDKVVLVLEYKVKGKQQQYQAIDEAIKTTQFIRNKAIRYWIDAPKEAKINKIALT